MQPADTLTRTIERRFEELSAEWRSMLEGISSRGALDGDSRALRAFLRSPARVEQMFGGINTQLWDDPFEWTLPEALGSTARVEEYLDEVDAARASGFKRIATDADLARTLWTPFGEMPLADLILRTLCEAVRLAADAGAESVPGQNLNSKEL